MLANVRPRAKYLMEDFYYAGGLRALLAELEDLLDLDCRDGQRPTLGENIEGREVYNDDVIRRGATRSPGGGGLVVLRATSRPTAR